MTFLECDVLEIKLRKFQGGDKLALSNTADEVNKMQTENFHWV